ncbi:MAG: hypothetical protein GY828_05840, partial [Candidatus Gracilibacteria bacterium]|nr:hypothetical protein [Candidatus Gracilibacteria bacterium]
MTNTPKGQLDEIKSPETESSLSDAVIKQTQDTNIQLSDILNGNESIQIHRINILHAHQDSCVPSEKEIFRQIEESVQSGDLYEAFNTEEKRDVYAKVYNYYTQKGTVKLSNMRGYLNSSCTKKLENLLNSDLIQEFESILFDGCFNLNELGEYAISLPEYQEYQNLESEFMQDFKKFADRKVSRLIKSIKENPTPQRVKNLLNIIGNINPIFGEAKDHYSQQVIKIMFRIYKLSITSHVDKYLTNQEKTQLINRYKEVGDFLQIEDDAQKNINLFMRHFHDKVKGHQLSDIEKSQNNKGDIDYKNLDLDKLKHEVISEGLSKNSIEETIDIYGLKIIFFKTKAKIQYSKTGLISHLIISIDDSFTLIEKIKHQENHKKGLGTQEGQDLIKETTSNGEKALRSMLSPLQSIMKQKKSCHQLYLTITSDGNICSQDHITKYSDLFEDIGEFEKLILTLVKRNFEKQTETLPSAFDEISEKKIIKDLEHIIITEKNKEISPESEEKIIDEILTSEDILADNIVHKVEEKEEVSAEEQEEIAAVRRRIKQEKLEAFARIKASPVKAIFNAFV